MRRILVPSLGLALALIASACGDPAADPGSSPADLIPAVSIPAQSTPAQSTPAPSAPTDPTPTGGPSATDSASGSPSAPSTDLTSSVPTETPERSGPDADYCTYVDTARAAQGIDELKQVVPNLVATLPSSAPAEAAAGLAVVVAAVDAAESIAHMSRLLDDITASETGQVAAYDEFEATTCDG